MQKKMMYALVAVIVVIVIVGAALAVILTTPPRKYQFELWYNSDGHYGDTEDELATVLKSSIEACGKVQVTLRFEPWAVYSTKRRNGELPANLLGWYPDYFDTDDYLSPFLVTGANRWAGSFYGNATVDQWIANEQSSTDPVARGENFTNIQNKLAEDVPYIPLFSGYSETAYVAGIQNVSLHPISFKWFIIDKPGSSELNGSTIDHITYLDPMSAYDYFSIELVNQIFDTLLVYEPDAVTIMPGLATEVPSFANNRITPDGLNYTYTLKPGLVFSDGTPLNASVVKRAIDRAVRINDPNGPAFLLYDTGKLGRDPNNANNTPVGAITVGANNLDITFRLSAPVPFFNDLMAFSVSAPVPWNYNDTGRQPDTVGSVIGSGPYRLTEHTPDVRFVLERNPLYGTRSTMYAPFGIPIIPVEDKVTLTIRSGSAALKNDLSVTPKLADVVYRSLNVEDLQDLQAQAGSLGITVDVATSPFIRYIVFNMNTITDVRVRRAIAYSVDRQAIDNTVFDGNVDPLYSLVPSGFPFSAPYSVPVFQTGYGDAKCPEANALWAQLGYAAGFAARDLIARDA
jgi:ABC-type transport system substrate-binding protein